MNQESQNTIQRLEKLLKSMDIPSNRKYINLNNLKWLHRNLVVRNSSNPDLEEAMKLVNLAIKYKYYKY